MAQKKRRGILPLSGEGKGYSTLKYLPAGLDLFGGECWLATFSELSLAAAVGCLLLRNWIILCLRSGEEMFSFDDVAGVLLDLPLLSPYIFAQQQKKYSHTTAE